VTENGGRQVAESRVIPKSHVENFDAFRELGFRLLVGSESATGFLLDF